MTYACDQCGRSFACGERVSFCPFCGRAYAAGQQEPTVRIVIEADSGRTVQAKYWNMAHQALRRVMNRLSSRLPAERQRYQLDWAEWLSKQRRCSSTAQFKRHCDEFLAKLGAVLRKDDADEGEPIALWVLAEAIDRDCLSLAEAMEGAEGAIQPPALDYTPYEPEERGTAVTEAYLLLLKELEQCKPVLYSILDENGMFAALSALGQEEMEDEAAAPARLTRQMEELAQKDYDPIFGEGYDELIQTFWQAVRCLTDMANRAYELPRLDEDEQAKQSALESHLANWQSLLMYRLDRLYENRCGDMMAVTQAIERVEQSLSPEE